MKKKVVITGSVILFVAILIIGLSMYKKKLAAEVLSLYGDDTDITGKGITDLRKMIAVYKHKPAGK